MDFLTFTLMVIAGGGVYYYFKKKSSYFEDHGVPYEQGIPIFGNMASVIFGIKSMSKMVLDIYEAHPVAKYVGAWSFGQPVIILRDPQLIKTIAIKNFDSFQNHAFGIDKGVDPLMGGNLFHIKGETWRETRNLLSPAFTSSKMKSMFYLMVECGKNFKYYISQLSDEDRKQIKTKDLFTKYTTDVVATCAFGLNVDSLKNPDNEFYVLGKKSVVFEGVRMFKFYMASICPSLMKLFNVKVIDEDVARFFRNTVARVIETRDKEKISRPDMIQLMMDARDSGKTTVKLDIDAITSQAFAFFIGGFDTTSTQMCNLAHQLAVSPDIQKKLQDEIDKIMGETEGELSYEDIQKMTYFDAVYSETLRMHSDVIILDRVCEKPLELPPALPGGKPFTIQPGMKIWMSGKSIHLDSNYYENPKKFDPDRYDQKKITINDELNLAFGIGPRGCIGFRFAILETKILFFHLLSQFNLVVGEKTKEGICLAIEPRNKIK